MLGRLTHALVLSPTEDVEGLAVYPGPVRRGKAWDAFAEEHAHELIVTASQLDAARAMRDAVHAHPEAAALLRSGDPEVTAQWAHETGLRMRCRFDWLHEHGPGFAELKTTRLAGLDAIAREVAGRCYHAQLALYAMGFEAVHGEPPLNVHLLVVQSAPPWDVVVLAVGPDVLVPGRALVERWIARVAECSRAERWPGAGDGVVDLMLPAWAGGGGGVEVGLVLDGEAV